MAGGDLLGVGLSGLLASQGAMDTISHNIANVNTPGYSRQRVELATRTPQWDGAQYFGSGVDIANVQRCFSDLLARDVRTSTSAAADQRVQHDMAAQLDALLGSAETGLGPVLQDFFNSIEDAAADPTDLSARELVLNQADQLAQRFHALDTRFQQLRANVQAQGRTAVGEINSIAQAIADLNSQIVSAGGASGQPNDLLDQRDQLVTDLAQRVGVTTTVQEDGALNVFIGTGQSLVMGGDARQLAVTGGGEDGSQFGILFVNRNGATSDVTSEITGGELGGLLAFGNGMLADAQRRTDQLALGVADQLNVQHQLGMDLRGQLGGLFFNDINSPGLQAARAAGDSENTGSAVLAVTVDRVDQLQDSDYRLLYDGSQYSLIRLSDNSVVKSASLNDLTNGKGFSITLTGSMAAGDSFTIRPAAGAGRQINVQLADGRALALAGPVRTAATVGNQGNANIGAADVTNLVGTPLGTAITLTYDAAIGGFDVSSPQGAQSPMTHRQTMA